MLQVHFLVGLEQFPGFGMQRDQVRLADAELAAQLADHQERVGPETDAPRVVRDRGPEARDARLVFRDVVGRHTEETSWPRL